MKKFTVVGTVNSPLYINFERGTTTLGNGKIAGFVYVSPEAFDSECYTDVYVKFDRKFDMYADEYEDYKTNGSQYVRPVYWTDIRISSWQRV